MPKDPKGDGWSSVDERGESETFGGVLPSVDAHH